MTIKNWQKISGQVISIYGVDMRFVNPTIEGDINYKVKLSQTISSNVLFEIELNSEIMTTTIKNEFSEITKEIDKDDLVSVDEFKAYINWAVPFVPNVQSYLTLIKEIINTPPSSSMVLQPPKQKVFMSKSTAKMPFTMSIDDNELW
jgi:hypothetical protein